MTESGKFGSLLSATRLGEIAPLVVILASLLFFGGQSMAQSSLSSTLYEDEIRVDGSLSEWASASGLQLSPSSEAAESSGDFKENDFQFNLKSRWNKNYLYLAIEWKDDVWDIEEVTRKNATWRDPETGRHRDRMYFFDNFKFHIRESDYDYTLWISPVSEDQGPFHWARLLIGYRGNERAGAKPMLRAESNGNTTTMEMMIVWKQLRLKPKGGMNIPLNLVISDSDLPGRFEETKIDSMKSIEWQGTLTLVE